MGATTLTDGGRMKEVRQKSRPPPQAPIARKHRMSLPAGPFIPGSSQAVPPRTSRPRVRAKCQGQVSGPSVRAKCHGQTSRPSITAAREPVHTHGDAAGSWPRVCRTTRPNRTSTGSPARATPDQPGRRSLRPKPLPSRHPIRSPPAVPAGTSPPGGGTALHNPEPCAGR
jgi:hypothetical protein